MAANGRPTARSDSEHGGLFADRTRMDTHEGRPIMEANATGSGLTNMWIKTKMDET